ncbi:immunoglobulin-like domain-containing protein [Winogradskyella tangerina]|uniref:immunoglobulin-like domain-containing protein n=1 Tax=Winogradskyella tangerina TaxID=2023240 RepID=UPI000DBE6C2D|nr:immunoglobulin-like domain-containing protein [Winogradskyella tangerina]
MKIKTLLVIVMMASTTLWSQSKVFWQKQTSNASTISNKNHQSLKEFQTFSLNADALRQALNGVPQRNNFAVSSNTILSFPNSEGKLERYSIKEASVMHPDLQARFPNIRSYVGQGVDDASSIIRFSLSPYGFSGMILSTDGRNSFIEPMSQGSDNYIVFSRKHRLNHDDDFECSVVEQINETMDSGMAFRNADDSILRTYRLAVSTTGEYTQYHGGTKAQALAAINTTMTRVNGIFEVDFNVTMILIANTDDVIYTSTTTDPYGNTTSGYNTQLQNTLTSVIGEANYDVGHLFANLQNNGNAGCIGCVCVNGQKGSGWTSATIPEGDFFDVDYVAHELGHQFGANHTWTFGGNEGTNVQVEPGSGTTIMSYAGITGSTDVEQNVTPNFHAVSIEQVTDYIKTTSCQTNTNTGNSVPVVNAGPNYTIPRGTPFILEGSATDADAGDVLSYVWEQIDENNASTTLPSTTATSGVAFRCYEPTTNPDRYFPRLETIKAGATSWQWEAVPNVARTLNFRLTVRDNVAGGGTNNSDDVALTVSGSAGPFVVNSPNTNVTWNAGTAQNVSWDVAGTTGNGINAATVDILLSTDGGDTYPITIASGVTNDGSHDIIVPNNQGNQNRIMVRGSNHIFFDISNTNFTIGAPVVCNATVPTGLAASNLAETTATLSWDAVPGATYDLRYRQTGTSTWTTNAVTGISSNLTGLTALTEYEAQVRSKCSGGSNSAYSSSVTFTTTDVQLNYCNSASTNVNDEFISRVQLNTIDNSSGAQFYSDFTNISTTLTKGDQYTITITPTWTGTLYNEGYGVWIDYNRDGDFTDAGEEVLTIAPTQATPVGGSFTIPAGAVENSTRMRVTLRYNQIPGPCDNFTYGEVEDYTVIIQGSGPDTEAPVITLNGASTINLDLGDTYTELGATATDNVDGNLTSSIVVGGDTVNTNVVGSYVVTYNVSDTAGNAATEVTRTVNVNPDTTPPVITLIGASTIDLNVGEAYNELGATATDNFDGDISANIVITGTVNTSVAGTYFVNYNVSDSSGNAAAQVTRTVNVEADTTPPVINLIGASTINLTVGDPYVEQGATATDNLDGDITANIVIGGSVDTNTAGSYQVTYNVSDAAGNAATQVIRTVNVSEPSTGCSGGISTFPYSEGFEGSIGAWTQSTADDINWSVNSGGTPSNSTGPSSAIEGSSYIYVEASGNGTGYPDKRAIITSPCFDLGGLTEATFNFSYHQFGAADMGTIDLEITDDEGATWTSIWNSVGNLGNSWQSASISLNAYLGKGVQLRFNRVTGSTWQADIAIDDVNLVGPPAPDTQAPSPATIVASNVTENSVDLTWSGATDNVGVTDYDLYQNGSLLINLTGTSYTATGLAESTNYDYYVIANDAAGNSSTASNTASITTLAAPTCSDGIQNGDETGVDCGGSSCAPCSSQDVILNEGFFESGLDGWIDGGSDCARRNDPARSFENNFSIRIRDNSGVASSMSLNNVDVTPYTSVEVDFYFYVFSMENGEDFWLRFFDGSSWITVQTWTRGVDINNNTFYNATVTINPAQYNFAANSGFRFQCDASGNNDQIFIDQVTITGISSGSRGRGDNLEVVGYYESPELSEADISIYPNPVKGNILNVEVSSLETFKYKIVNIQGRTVATGTSEGKVDVSKLEGGMYFIEINDGDEVLTKKFIKN